MKCINSKSNKMSFFYQLEFATCQIVLTLHIRSTSLLFSYMLQISAVKFNKLRECHSREVEEIITINTSKYKIRLLVWSSVHAVMKVAHRQTVRHLSHKSLYEFVFCKIVWDFDPDCSCWKCLLEMRWSDEWII